VLPFEIQNFFRIWKKQIFLCFALVFAFQVIVLQLNLFMISIVALPIYFVAVKMLTRRYTLRPISDGRMLFEIFTLSLIIRVAEVFVLGFIFAQFNPLGLPFMGNGDDINYHESMRYIYGYWQEYGLTTVEHTKIQFNSGAYSGYPYFGAFMMKIFGPNFYAARIGNAIASALTVLVVFGILANYTDRFKTIVTTLIFAFSPILTVFAACNLKDTLLLLCILTTVWSMTNFLLGRRWLVSIVAALASIAFMIFCRPVSIFVLLVSGLIFLFFRFRNRPRSTLLVVTNILLLCATLFLWRWCDNRGLTTEYEEFVQLNIDATQRTIAGDSKAGVARFSAAKLLSAPLFIACSPFLPPVTMAYFETKEVTINYTFHGMLAYVTLLPAMIYGVLIALKNRKYDPIPLLLVIVCFFYKVAQANSLLTILSPRQSLPAIALLMLLIPAGLDQYSRRPHQVFTWTVNAATIFITLAFNVYRYFY